MQNNTHRILWKVITFVAKLHYWNKNDKHSVYSLPPFVNKFVLDILSEVSNILWYSGTFFIHGLGRSRPNEGRRGKRNF